MKRSKKRNDPVTPAKMFAFSVPQTQLVLFRQPMLHINCNGEVEVENSRGILIYNTQCIRLDMGDQAVQIDGDGLVMDTYQKSRITIHGKIFSIRFYFSKGADA